jgi:hypothetical protein
VAVAVDLGAQRDDLDFSLFSLPVDVAPLGERLSTFGLLGIM